MDHRGKVIVAVIAALLVLGAAGAGAFLLTSDEKAAGGGASRIPAGWQLCVNDEAGYSIAYPEDWYTSHLDAATACRLFDAEPFTLEPNTEWPAVDLEVIATGERVAQVLETKTDAGSRRVLRREQTTVAGAPAVLLEAVVTGGGIFETGTRIYGYVIDRDGKAFVVETIAGPGTSSATYDELRAVVDTAAKSLRFPA